MRIVKATNLTPSACGGRLGRGLGRYSCAFSSRNLFQWPRGSSRSLFGLRGALPVVDHLCRQDNVQDKPSNEPIKNELVVDFLQRGKDSRKRTDEVVEHLLQVNRVSPGITRRKILPQRHSAVRFLPHSRSCRFEEPCWLHQAHQHQPVDTTWSAHPPRSGQRAAHTHWRQPLQ